MKMGLVLFGPTVTKEGLGTDAVGQIHPRIFVARDDLVTTVLAGYLWGDVTVGNTRRSVEDSLLKFAAMQGTVGLFERRERLRSQFVGPFINEEQFEKELTDAEVAIKRLFPELSI